jgi:hypothetical protein
LVVVGAAATAGVLIAVGALFVAITATGPLTTDTRSSDLPDDAAKVAFLRNYLKLHSDVEAAEFHIVFADNSRGLPAPSDFDMQVAIKIDRDELPLWTADVQQTTESVDLSWGYELLPNTDRWAIQSKPDIYTRGSTVVAVFSAEGIVFKRAHTFGTVGSATPTEQTETSLYQTLLPLPGLDAGPGN